MMIQALSDFAPICRFELSRFGRKNPPCPHPLNNKRKRCGLTPHLLPQIFRSPRPTGQGSRLPADKSCRAAEDN